VRRRGFALVEVLVAAGILALCAGILVESIAYARVQAGAVRHRERAAAWAADSMESALRLSYADLPVGIWTITRPLEDDGSLPCTLTLTVLQDSTWPDVQGLRRVSVQATWTEPLLRGSPVAQVRLHGMIGDPVP
jgi:prepilin-type N-terminal cleavage/methylation domain-containing protein